MSSVFKRGAALLLLLAALSLPFVIPTFAQGPAIEIYNPLDTSLKGPAEDYLRDPRVTMVNGVPPNSVFDKSRKQQTWKFPAGTGDVDAYQLRVFPDGTAKLVDYFVPGEIASVPNIQNNASGDGFVAKSAAIPLRQLQGKEKLVLIQVQAGLIVYVSWWVRDGDPSVPPPSTGNGFSDADRAVLQAIKMFVSKILANQQ